jgi:hypothetical protein
VELNSDDSTNRPGGADRAPDPASVRLSGTDERPVIEVTISAPLATVWPHLRDPVLIRRWHGWEAEELDAEIEFIYHEHAEADDDAHVIRSKGGAAPGDRFDAEAADPDTTVVRITRGPRGTNPDWDAMYDDITQGWLSFLAQLKFAVEQHPGVDRRTVFRGRFEPGPRLQDLLGVESPVAQGQPYRITGADAPQIAGTVWFHTGGQLGLTVTTYGPGLVVVADKPGPEPDTAPASMLIVSTFGLTADEYAEVESAWSQWWSAHNPEPAA